MDFLIFTHFRDGLIDVVEHFGADSPKDAIATYEYKLPTDRRALRPVAIHVMPWPSSDCLYEHGRRTPEDMGRLQVETCIAYVRDWMADPESSAKYRDLEPFTTKCAELEVELQACVEDPECHLCLVNQGEHVPAYALAPQSTDQGQTITWVLVCEAHGSGWWEGCDWGPAEFRYLEADGLMDRFEALIEMADEAESLLTETGAWVVINSSDASTWSIYDTKQLPADPDEYEALMEGWN